jgi:HEAT repeat protein
MMVNASAMAALVQIGPAAAGGLITTLQSGSPTARMRAAQALVPLRVSSAIPALFAALDDDSPAVQHYAEEALERLGVGMTFVIL